MISTAIVVDVNGRPAPKGSRISAKTKDGRPYTYPASQYEAPWVEAVKRRTQVVMRHHEQPEPPYAVALEFRLERPARPKTAWSTKHDLDKLARAVIDGLVKGGAMADDRHVIALTATKRYAQPGETEGVNAQVAGVMEQAGF